MSNTLKIGVTRNVKIEDDKYVTRIHVEVPGHGYYSSILSVFEALTFPNAVVRMDHVLDGSFGDYDEGEEGLAHYWKCIREACLGDEQLLAVVVRIMAGDTMGNENEEAALESVSRWYS